MGTPVGEAFSAIAREQDPERLLDVAVAQAAALFDAEVVALYVSDAQGKFFRATVASELTWGPEQFEQHWATSEGARGSMCARFDLEGHRGVFVLTVGPPAQTDLLAALTIHTGLAWVAANERVRARATASIHRTLVEQLPAVTYYRALDKPGIPSFVSPQVADLFGYSPEEVVADPEHFRSHVHPDDRPTIDENQPASRQVGDQPMRVEYRLRHRDGTYRWVHNHALSVRADPDAARMVLGVIIDVTQQKQAEEAKREAERQMEEQLRQTHKFDAVGRLAGGVAHDFNNLLGVILGYTELLKRRGLLDEKGHNDLVQIVEAAERAKWLTAQLLSLTGLQVRAPRVVDVGDLIHSLESLLASMLGADVELIVQINHDDGRLCALLDPGELQQVIINLVSNARDACARRGEIALSVQPDPNEKKSFLIEVRDNGSGIDAATAGKIFEPFFTTKERGKGTGHGLSMARGVVQTAGGTIDVESDVGKGTLFRISLPRATAVPSSDSPSESVEGRASPNKARGTILVVDDEPALRRLLCRILRLNDYLVLEAANGHQALELASANPPCDLLLTDVVMPGMSGREIHDELLRQGLSMPVLFMSGYTADTVFGHGIRASEYTLLSKPFTQEKLLEAVREALNRKS